MKKILVINGNPQKTSYCRALSESYVEGATKNGHQVSTVHLSELEFDPILHNAYDSQQLLELDLVMLQSRIKEADHLVFVYPIWWGTVPSLLKGVLDRILLPDFAYKFQKGSLYPQQLLKGKTARLIETMDTPPWYYSLVYGAPAHKMMKRTVLQFCGIRPVKISALGPVKGSTMMKREKWLAHCRRLGSQGI